VAAPEAATQGSTPAVQAVPVHVTKAARCVTGPRPSGITAACSAGDALDEALGAVGRDRCTLALDDGALRRSGLDWRDRRLVPGFAGLQRRPSDLVAHGRTLAATIDAALDAPSPVASAIAVAAAERGIPVDACAEPAWASVPAGDPAPLEGALGAPRGALAGVPLELQRALVPIVRAIQEADREVRAAQPWSAARRRDATQVPGWILGQRRFELTAAVLDDFDRADLARVARAATRVALAVEGADLARFTGLRVPKVVVPTRYGAFVLAGPTSDVHLSETTGAMLVLDTGGDDQYLGEAGASSFDRPVSVVVDLGGNDRYASRVGAGVAGVGLAFDYGRGDDTYVGKEATQGAGALGVGVLFDAGGDDAYVAGGFAQGAGAWGVGLLLDAHGDDRYAVDTSGQGFGFTLGVGVLADADGDDRYFADPGDPSLGGVVKYPSAQLPGPPATALAGNMSFAQGCGAGHRPDWPDPGFPLPGGMGVLRDARGRDVYRASVFAQGCAFVQGVGLLLEGDGDDTYDGLYYVQGSAAHQAAALLLDAAGDDTYDDVFPVTYASLGLGHDLSVGVHYDAGGDDRYAAPGLSLGSGTANGIGVFVNTGGADLYRILSDSSLGVGILADAPASREVYPSLGVFVRAGGRTTYRAATASDVAAGGTWRRGAAPGVGVGVDRPRGDAAW
jgi:hypothetical protein